MRYQMRYRTYQWNSKTLRNESVEKTRSFPWLWLVRTLLMVMKEHWFEGGTVVDTATGAMLMTWKLTGNITSDGRVHVYENGVDRNPAKMIAEAKILAVLEHIAKRD